MEKCIIHGEHMTSRDQAHAEIARALRLPEYYVVNLDALWDELSAIRAELTLENPAPMLNALGVYGCKLLQTMFEAAAENPDFHFRAED